MYLVVDNATNNVLSECDSFAEAEQYRIRVVGMNPQLAEWIEVVDLDRSLAEPAAETHEAAPA